jgi:hypothetical protein
MGVPGMSTLATMLHNDNFACDNNRLYEWPVYACPHPPKWIAVNDGVVTRCCGVHKATFLSRGWSVRPFTPLLEMTETA